MHFPIVVDSRQDAAKTALRVLSLGSVSGKEIVPGYSLPAMAAEESSVCAAAFGFG
jgi:hypothetical protein